ncbi:transmembrane protein 266 isoform X1 [Petromyzon marinus]|uniref:transmembrane protein 266 isoform X1 n=2 Tax=Petromyzon marinus TaxID=7757 RepID=UPI003F6F7F3E
MSSPLLPSGLTNAVMELDTISRLVEDDSERKGNDTRVATEIPLLDLAPASPGRPPSEDGEVFDDSPTWPRPCCGRRGAQLWHMMLLSYRLNCFLVAAVVLVILLLTFELLIDVRILQFRNAVDTAAVMHWISFLILTVFFVESICRIIVIGLGDYIENKLEVFDGAVIILSFAPMVASTVANGPHSPWDGLSLIISLRVWRFKQIIDAYVLPIKEENELILQHCERVKQQAEEEVERLTHICQEQAFEIRQLRAHLARQESLAGAESGEGKSTPTHLADAVTMAPGSEADDEDEDEGILDMRRQRSLRRKGVSTVDDMNNYVNQYYTHHDDGDGGHRDIQQGVAGPSAATIDIDVHQPMGPRTTTSSYVQVDVLHYGFDGQDSAAEGADQGQPSGHGQQGRSQMPNNSGGQGQGQFQSQFMGHVPTEQMGGQNMGQLPFQITGQIPSRMSDLSAGSRMGDPMVDRMGDRMGEDDPSQMAFHITGQVHNRITEPYLSQDQTHASYPIMGQFPNRISEQMPEQDVGHGLRQAPYQITGQAPNRLSDPLLDQDSRQATGQPQYQIMGQIPNRMGGADILGQSSCSASPPSAQHEKLNAGRSVPISTGNGSSGPQGGGGGGGKEAEATAGSSGTATTTYRETYKVISLEHRNLIFSSEDTASVTAEPNPHAHQHAGHQHSGHQHAASQGASRGTPAGGSPLHGERAYRGSRASSVYRSERFGGSGSVLDSASEIGSDAPSAAAALLSSALEGRPILEQEVCIVKMRTYQAPLPLPGENPAISLASLYKAMEESGDFSSLNHS